VEQRRVELLASALRIGLSAKTQVIAFSKVAATKEKLRFSCSFPFLPIAYTLCAVIFGHVLATWKSTPNFFQDIEMPIWHLESEASSFHLFKVASRALAFARDRTIICDFVPTAGVETAPSLRGTDFKSVGSGDT
jgi:hypothetical protein